MNQSNASLEYNFRVGIGYFLMERQIRYTIHTLISLFFPPKYSRGQMGISENRFKHITVLDWSQFFFIAIREYVRVLASMFRRKSHKEYNYCLWLVWFDFSLICGRAAARRQWWWWVKASKCVISLSKQHWTVNTLNNNKNNKRPIQKYKSHVRT